MMFDANQGQVTPSKKDVVQWKELGELPTPEREGHVFLGWFVGD